MKLTVDITGLPPVCFRRGHSPKASKIRSKAEPVNISRGMDPAAAASAAGALGFPQALAAAAQAAAQAAAAHAAQTRLDQRSQVR